MTNNEAKEVVRTMIELGISKDAAFQAVSSIMHESFQEKLGNLERFRYEINAEELRNQGA